VRAMLALLTYIFSIERNYRADTLLFFLSPKSAACRTNVKIFTPHEKTIFRSDLHR
jgi:hypothetical protein